MADIPIVMGAAGAVPTPIATLIAQLIATATAQQPGLTTELPGSLVDDVTGTQAAGLSLIDQARVALINSLTPYGANLFLLQQLGNVYLGVGNPNPATNTTVSVVFTATASPGFTIPPGFVVSDGTYQYVLSDGGIIGAGGSTTPLVAVASQAGTWAVPAGTVTQLITSVPSGINLSVTNPSAGTPGAGTETESDYRARILQAGLAASQGMARYLKTLLAQVPGVQQRLISVRQSGTGYEVICGGYTDQYQVAGAIFAALFDINTLVPSSNTISGITKSLAAPAAPGLTANTSGGTLATGTVWVTITYVASPGETQYATVASVSVTGPSGQVVVTSPSAETGATGYNVYASTTNLASSWVKQNTSEVAIGTNYSIDSLVTGTAAAPTRNTTGIVTTTLWGAVTNNASTTIASVNPSAYNGTFTATVFTPTTFSTGVDTSADAAYVSGGVVTPNARNIAVSVNDYPDTYSIPFVNPPQQTVAITVTWNTSQANFVGQAAVAQLVQPALVSYINGIGVGQPILVHQLEQAFLQAVASILPAYLVTVLSFAVSISGVGVSPTAGTEEIQGDPESYFYTTTASITVTQA